MPKYRFVAVELEQQYITYLISPLGKLHSASNKNLFGYVMCAPTLKLNDQRADIAPCLILDTKVFHALQRQFEL